MKTVILAAGIGSRLHPLTEDKPKCLIKVGEKTILEYQLDAIQNCGLNFEDVFIITGHLSDNIENVIPPEISIIKNELYKTTNNIYSLWLASKYISDDCLILNSDTLFHKDILQKILLSNLENSLVLDDYKELGLEEMKVILKNNKLYDINKTMNPKKSDGEYIGIAKFSKVGFEILSNILDEFIKDGAVDDWYERAFLQASKVLDISFVSTDSLPWIEIDDFTDLQKANELIQSLR